MPDETPTELTVTVMPIFTVPELPGETEFTSYEDAVNTAAITLGVGARFSVNRTNVVQGVEATIIEGTYQGPVGAAPTPPADPTPEVPDATDAPAPSTPAVPVDAGVDVSPPADPNTDGGVVADTAGDGTDPGADVPAADPVAEGPPPVVAGDDTDPTDAGPTTVADVPTDASDVTLGQPQEPDQPVFVPPAPTVITPDVVDPPAPDPSTVVNVDPPVVDPALDAAMVTDPPPVVTPPFDPSPIDTTNAIFDPTPTVAPTAAPADDTSPTETAPTADS